MKANGRLLYRGLKAAAREDGATAVEFGLVMPVLLLVLLSITKFGITMNNYIQLTDGVRLAARQFAISRGSATPYTSTTTVLQNATPGLTYASIATTVTTSTGTCNTDAACGTDLLIGTPITVTSKYSCDLTVMGVNYLPGCQLVASTTELVE